MKNNIIQMPSPFTLEHFDLLPTSTPLTHWQKRFDYDGYFKRPAACGLDVYQQDDRAVAIVTELLEGKPGQIPNPGTSVTNRIEEIGYQLGLLLAGDAEAFFRAPQEYILVEHLPQRSESRTWDLVRFGGFLAGRPTRPEWYQLNREQITRLIGQEFNQEY